MANQTPTPTNTPKQLGLHIFKPGRHTAMSGATLAFTDADLAATARAYNPALHEAPLVVGHPAHDMPAYGWVQALAYNEGGTDAEGGSASLWATPAQVNPDFADMVAAGAFKKISAAFYAPDAPTNPVPGVYYLRHVGFLGAAAPAVKGLRKPEFADAEEGVLTFTEWDDVDNASLWRSLREWLIGKFGQDEADRVVPGYKVQSLEQAAAAEVAQDQQESQTQTMGDAPQFSEPQPQEKPVTPEEKAALEAENTRLRAELAAVQTAAVHAANVAFCDKLAGVPVDARSLFAQALTHFDTLPQPIEFAEGDTRVPLADKLKAALAALPALVPSGEHATAARAAGASAQADELAFAEGADPARLAQHQAIKAYMVQHKTDYPTAAAALMR